MIRNVPSLNSMSNLTSISTSNYYEEDDAAESETLNITNMDEELNLNDDLIYENKSNENNISNLKDIDEQYDESVTKKSRRGKRGKRGGKRGGKKGKKSQSNYELKYLLEEKIENPLKMAKLYENYDALLIDYQELSVFSEKYGYVEELDDGELESFITELGPILVRTLEDLDISFTIDFELDDVMSSLAEDDGGDDEGEDGEEGEEE